MQRLTGAETFHTARRGTLIGRAGEGGEPHVVAAQFQIHVIGVVEQAGVQEQVVGIGGVETTAQTAVGGENAVAADRPVFTGLAHMHHGTVQGGDTGNPHMVRGTAGGVDFHFKLGPVLKLQVAIDGQGADRIARRQGRAVVNHRAAHAAAALQAGAVVHVQGAGQGAVHRQHPGVHLVMAVKTGGVAGERQGAAADHVQGAAAGADIAAEHRIAGAVHGEQEIVQLQVAGESGGTGARQQCGVGVLHDVVAQGHVTPGRQGAAVQLQGAVTQGLVRGQRQSAAGKPGGAGKARRFTVQNSVAGAVLDQPVAVEHRQKLIVLTGVVEDQRAVAGAETHLLDVQHAGVGGAGLTAQV